MLVHVMIHFRRKKTMIVKPYLNIPSTIEINRYHNGHFFKKFIVCYGNPMNMEK